MRYWKVSFIPGLILIAGGIALALSSSALLIAMGAFAIIAGIGTIFFAPP